MKIFSVIRQFVTLQPAIMQFVLDKIYYRKEHHMHGSFYVQPNQQLSISSLQIEVVQTLHISKDKTEKTSLGEKTYRQQVVVERFEKYQVDFSFALKFPRATKWERTTYKGDLGPLNKATDKAKTQLFSYAIIATIKLKGKKDPLVFEEKIKVE